MVKRRRRFGWLLVGMGAFLLVAPIAMIGYGTWQESNLTRQWEAKLSARARHAPTHPQPIPDFLEMISNDPPEARLTRLPTRGDVDPRLTKEKELREQLIIEFCSR